MKPSLIASTHNLHNMPRLLRLTTGSPKCNTDLGDWDNASASDYVTSAGAVSGLVECTVQIVGDGVMKTQQDVQDLIDMLTAAKPNMPT